MDQATAIVAAGLIGAVAGIGGQWVAGLIAHGRERDARKQERLGRTYERVMTQVNRIAVTIERTEPDLWFGTYPPELPAALSDEELLTLETLIGLYGTERVRRALLQFARKQREFNAAVGLLRDLRAGLRMGTKPSELNAPMESVRQTRSDVYERAKEIEAMCRAELAGGGEPPLGPFRRPKWRP
jgi:hypothetical protein